MAEELVNIFKRKMIENKKYFFKILVFQVKEHL
jgi:hypothetical protein